MNKRLLIDPRSIVTLLVSFACTLIVLSAIEKREKEEEWQRYLKSLPKSFDTSIPCPPYTTCWERLAYQAELREKPTILTFDAELLWEMK